MASKHKILLGMFFFRFEHMRGDVPESFFKIPLWFQQRTGGVQTQHVSHCQNISLPSAWVLVLGEEDYNQYAGKYC